MKTAYDYTMEFISVLADIDAKVEMKAGIKGLEEEERLDKEIDALEEYVGTDEYVEDVAKDKLGLVYPNEILFEAEP